MKIEYHDTHQSGTFWPPTDPPFSRLETGPEADTAEAFAITQEDMIALGEDTETISSTQLSMITISHLKTRLVDQTKVGFFSMPILTVSLHTTFDTLYKALGMCSGIVSG